MQTGTKAEKKEFQPGVGKRIAQSEHTDEGYKTMSDHSGRRKTGRKKKKKAVERDSGWGRGGR